MAARPPQVAGKVKYGYVIVTATVDSQRDMTRLVQLPNFFHPWTATDCVCTKAWPAVRDAHAGVSLPYFRLMCVHRVVRVRRRTLIKPMNARSSHSFDGFHTCI